MDSPARRRRGRDGSAGGDVDPAVIGVILSGRASAADPRDRAGYTKVPQCPRTEVELCRAIAWLARDLAVAWAADRHGGGHARWFRQSVIAVD